MLPGWSPCRRHSCNWGRALEGGLDHGNALGGDLGPGGRSRAEVRRAPAASRARRLPPVRRCARGHDGEKGWRPTHAAAPAGDQSSAARQVFRFRATAPARCDGRALPGHAPSVGILAGLVTQHPRHHDGHFGRSQLRPRGVLFQDLRVCPASGAVNLATAARPSSGAPAARFSKELSAACARPARKPAASRRSSMNSGVSSPGADGQRGPHQRRQPPNLPGGPGAIRL